MRRFFEQIEWRCPGDEMPDDDESVLLCAVTANGEVGEGFHEDGAWHWAGGGSVNGDVMWCSMPEGRPATNEVLQAELAEMLELARSAQCSLSVEDYGDAVAGVVTRLERLLEGRGA